MARDSFAVSMPEHGMSSTKLEYRVWRQADESQCGRYLLVNLSSLADQRMMNMRSRLGSFEGEGMAYWSSSLSLFSVSSK